MSLFQLVHISHRAELSWITASHQLLLGGNTLPTECGGGRGREGGGWGGADILQLLLILTPGKAKHQVKKKTKIVTNIKVKGMTVAVVAVVTEVTLINFQIDLVG